MNLANSPIKMKCELIADNKGWWRIEYVQQGVKVQAGLTQDTREAAIQEAIRQGFTKINIYRETDPGHLFADGFVVVPKETLGKGEGENGRPD
jgi:hypothetical protein